MVRYRVRGYSSVTPISQYPNTLIRTCELLFIYWIVILLLIDIEKDSDWE